MTVLDYLTLTVELGITLSQLAVLDELPAWQLACLLVERMGRA